MKNAVERSESTMLKHTLRTMWWGGYISGLLTAIIVLSICLLMR